MLDTYIKWFEAHERALIVALVMGLGVYGFNHWVDKSAEAAAAKAAVAAQIAESAKEQDAKNAALVAQLQASFNAQQALRDQEIANLVSAIAQRDRATEQKVTEVQKITDPLPALEALQSAYGSELNFDGTPITGPGKPPITATVPLLAFDVEKVKAFAVTKLEGDAAKADYANERLVVKNDVATIQQQAGLLSSQKTEIDGLHTLVTANQNQCEAEKKDLKAQARKSKWHLFWWGFGAGYVADEAVHRLLHF